MCKATEPMHEVKKDVVLCCELHPGVMVSYFTGLHPECPLCLKEKAIKEIQGRIEGLNIKLEEIADL